MYFYTDKEMKVLSNKLGISDPIEIFKSSIPDKFILKSHPNIEGIEDEYKLKSIFLNKISKNRLRPPNKMYVGVEVEPTYVPSVVKYLISRGEFLTSYTPYQPEISQGVLQALFEYQSIIAELTGMDVVNSSMYDWSTAIAEALRMAVRVSGMNRVAIPRYILGNKKAVVETYLYGSKTEVQYFGLDKSGEPNIDEIEDICEKGCAGIYLEYPNFYGYINSNLKKVSNCIHSHGGLLIVGVDLWALPLLQPPSKFDADIVVGEGQVLGLDMNYGGPLLGIFAVKGDYRLIRQMPGRIIGMTKTIYNENRAFTMILQTREQHIRREKATSNICTNEALSAIQLAIYVSLIGKDGLLKISLKMLKSSHKLNKLLLKLGFKNLYGLPFFRRFTMVYDANKLSKIYGSLHDMGYLPGYLINNKWILTVNQYHTLDDVVNFYNDVSKVVKGV